MNILENINIDKSQFMVLSMDEKGNVNNYWHSKSPKERLRAIEIMRSINYGQDISTKRLQRIFEVIERS